MVRGRGDSKELAFQTLKWIYHYLSDSYMWQLHHEGFHGAVIAAVAAPPTSILITDLRESAFSTCCPKQWLVASSNEPNFILFSLMGEISCSSYQYSCQVKVPAFSLTELYWESQFIAIVPKGCVFSIWPRDGSEKRRLAVFSCGTVVIHSSWPAHDEFKRSLYLS